MPKEGLADGYIHRAYEVAKAAAGNNGAHALNHPEDLAKLISVVANKLHDLANGTETD